MSIEKVRAAFAAQGIADRIRELDEIQRNGCFGGAGAGR